MSMIKKNFVAKKKSLYRHNPRKAKEEARSLERVRPKAWLNADIEHLAKE